MPFKMEGATFTADFSTVGEFRSWLHAAAPGDSFVYFLGRLAYARSQKGFAGGDELYILAHETMRLSDQGVIHLTQRKLDIADGFTGAARYEYIATKASPPAPKPKAFSPPRRVREEALA